MDHARPLLGTSSHPSIIEGPLLSHVSVAEQVPQASTAAAILPSSSSQEDLLQPMPQVSQVHITMIPDDGPLMHVAELLPAFNLIESNQEDRFAIMSTPSLSGLQQPETALVDNINNDSFINSIFNTGLLADSTDMTPPYPPSHHATPLTSPVAHNEDFSPDRIKRMFEDANITETPVADLSAHFEMEDIGKAFPTPMMTSNGLL